jgi:hypothetical protein
MVVFNEFIDENQFVTKINTQKIYWIKQKEKISCNAAYIKNFVKKINVFI